MICIISKYRLGEIKAKSYYEGFISLTRVTLNMGGYTKHGTFSRDKATNMNLQMPLLQKKKEMTNFMWEMIVESGIIALFFD